MNKKRNSQIATRRSGITLLEVVVATVVLVAIMSLITTLCFRTSLVWRDIAHHRVAMAELSNQLERLTAMDHVQVRDELNSLEPSEPLMRTLNEPRLTGEMVPSKIGYQIHLRLNWKRRLPGKSVELTGWIPVERITSEQ